MLLFVDHLADMVQCLGCYRRDLPSQGPCQRSLYYHGLELAVELGDRLFYCKYTRWPPVADETTETRSVVSPQIELQLLAHSLLSDWALNEASDVSHEGHVE